MFEVYQCRSYKVVDEQGNFLHGDGSVLLRGEFWPTKEQAQAVLDKYRPKHVWKHGDVFSNMVSPFWIYLEPNKTEEPIVVNLARAGGGGTAVCQLNGDDVKFLFNTTEQYSPLGDVL